MNIKNNLRKALNEANILVKADDLAKIKPKLGKDDVVKVVEAGKPKTFLADRHYTHFAILDGKIAEAWNFKGVDPEDLKLDRKHYFYFDLQDRYPDKKMKEFKIVTRKALEKRGIDINDQNNWLGSQPVTTEAKNNPWAICTASVGREDKKKYERCVMDVKKKLNMENINDAELSDSNSNNYMFWQNLKTMKGAIEDMLEMNQSEIDNILSDGHGWALDHIATSADDVEEVYHFLENRMGGEISDEEYGSVHNIDESEYQGKDVELGKPMRGDVKKYKVYVKNDKGNVVKVNFGDKNMEIKRDNPERRKSFRARHGCDNPGPRWKAKYWSCKFWSTKSVSDLLGEKDDNPCWKGYEIIGTKEKDGKQVPNCVKIKDSVKPKMSKNELIETVLNKTNSKSKNTLTVREFVKQSINESKEKYNFFIVNIDTGEITNKFTNDKEVSKFIKNGGTACDRCEFMDREAFAAYLGGTYLKDEPKGLDLNGKKVDLNSIEVDGVEASDAPDYSNSYVSYAEYVDGTPLSDKEIEMLEGKYRGLAQEILFNRN